MITTLTIGTDRKLFEIGSGVLSRVVGYGEKMRELHIIVFSLRKHNLKYMQVGNVHIHPTNSMVRMLYLYDAYRIARDILNKKKQEDHAWVLSAQDPFETSIPIYVLSRAYNIPFQAQLHTDVYSPYFRRSVLNKIRFLIASFILPRAQGLRVVSSSLADKIAHTCGIARNKIKVLPVYVDIQRIKDTPITVNIKELYPQFTFHIFMASRLTDEKRIDVAIRMMKGVVEDYPQAGLIIAGEGNRLSALQAMVSDYGLDKHIIFIGWQHDVFSYYKTADLFLVTSEYEGYGMTIVEALASGCPVASTDVGVARDLISGEFPDRVCPVGDYTCLARNIIMLAKSGTDNVLQREQKMALPKSFSVTKEQYIDAYVSLLEELL